MEKHHQLSLLRTKHSGITDCELLGIYDEQISGFLVTNSTISNPKIYKALCNSFTCFWFFNAIIAKAHSQSFLLVYSIFSQLSRMTLSCTQFTKNFSSSSHVAPQLKWMPDKWRKIHQLMRSHIFVRIHSHLFEKKGEKEMKMEEKRKIKSTNEWSVLEH